ncbi:MAG: phage tail sheath C-terminal domain-containing protein [Bacteroidota bacterium]
MSIYKSPDVYTEEVSTAPPSVAQVSSAVPAFLGYTEKAAPGGKNAHNTAVRISTFLEFKEIFGGPESTRFSVNLDPNGTIAEINADAPQSTLYYALDFYFKNGGSACYVISVGNYDDAYTKDAFLSGLHTLSKEDEPTLIGLGEATRLPEPDYYEVLQMALAQCANLKDRFCILDVLPGDERANGFRNGIGTNNLKYGAAYTPYLQTSLNHRYDDSSVTISGLSSVETLGHATDLIRVTYAGPAADSPKFKINKGTAGTIAFSISAGVLTIANVGEGVTVTALLDAWDAFPEKGNFNLEAVSTGPGLVESLSVTNLAVTTVSTMTLAEAKNSKTALYSQVVAELAKERVVLAPSAGVAGAYCATDRDRGVWKSPANISLNAVIGPMEKITSADQESLNLDPDSGKSINAIRSFFGKGTLIWGARTLAGNDNEWRYVSVRRLFNMIEESTKKASYFAVFEPNDAATWLKVKAMIDSYLYGIWQQGALAGSVPEQAYFVNIGLGKTMTPQDILEGRMIVEIGIAAVRPAEFIVLRFSHKLQEA